MVCNERYRRGKRRNHGREAVSGGVAPAAIYPAQMTPKVLVNGYTAAGWGVNALSAAGYTSGASGMPAIGLGATTANVLKPILNLTGPGILDYLSLIHGDTVPRGARVQIILDGVTVFDYTSGTFTNSGTACFVGALMNNAGTSPTATTDPIMFRSSCVVNVASTVSEGACGLSVQYLWRPV